MEFFLSKHWFYSFLYWLQTFFFNSSFTILLPLGIQQINYALNIIYISMWLKYNFQMKTSVRERTTQTEIKKTHPILKATYSSSLCSNCTYKKQLSDYYIFYQTCEVGITSESRINILISGKYNKLINWLMLVLVNLSTRVDHLGNHDTNHILNLKLKDRAYDSDPLRWKARGLNKVAFQAYLWLYHESCLTCLRLHREKARFLQKQWKVRKKGEWQEDSRFYKWRLIITHPCFVSLEV